MSGIIPMSWGIAPDLAVMPATWLNHPAIAGFNSDPRIIPHGGRAPELCQLAGVWSEAQHPQLADALVDPKLNGNRALFLGTADPFLVSREGSPMTCAAHCMPSLLALQAAYGKPMMFDGEFVVPGANAPAPTTAAFRRNRPEPAGQLWLFDAVPLDQWATARTTAPLRYRRETLAVMARQVMRVQLGIVTGSALDADATQCIARNFWRSGFEGVVVKDASSSYVRGRSSSWLKLKQGE